MMRRHDLVYLRPDAACLALTCPASASTAAAWMAWLRNGRPLVATRQTGAPNEVQLAIVLPDSMQRQRLSGVFDRAAVARISAPLSVSACVARLSAPLQAPLLALEATTTQCGAQLGVYGSLAWEALSGERYRHADSDIDVICDVRQPAQLHACLAALTATADSLPCRLDGELRFPSGAAVAWRELAAKQHEPNAMVLSKGPREVQLTAVRTLLASLSASATLSHSNA